MVPLGQYVALHDVVPKQNPQTKRSLDNRNETGVSSEQPRVLAFLYRNTRTPKRSETSGFGDIASHSFRDGSTHIPRMKRVAS
jgi:hypothetical protein